MSEATADISEVRQAQLFAWRMECFLKLGFSAIDAEDLAASEVDLHEAETLISSGCSATLAGRILR